MSKIEVDLSDRVEGDIDQMVAQGEFVNWDEAVEALLSRGVAAYNVEEEETTQVDENLFQQSVADQQDPALREDPGDDDFTF